MDIAKLCADSHRISKEHGWLDNPRPYTEISALFHSELSEALEDYRNNHPVTEIYYEAKQEDGEVHILTWEQLQDPITGGGGYKSVKPCGIPIEFADFIIRIAQFGGTNGLPLEEAVNKVLASMKGQDVRIGDFGETLAQLHADVSFSYLADIGRAPETVPQDKMHYLACAWVTTFNFCASNGIDLDKAILEKQRYNETRPFRHGGKKI